MVMSEFIGLWSHALAAVLFAVMALWQAGVRHQGWRNRALAIAFGITAIWAMAASVSGPHSLLSITMETVRNLAWLGFMYVLLRQGRGVGQSLTVMALYVVLALLSIAAAVVMVSIDKFPGSPRIADALFYTGMVLRMSVAVGALVLLHNLYSAAAPEARWGVLLPIAALAGMWTYDLNLYTLTYLTKSLSLMLFAMRGAIMAMLVPLFLMASKRNQHWRLKLSRRVTFQSLSLVAIGVYLICMVIATRAIELVGGSYAELIQITIIFGMSVAALVLLPSGRVRAWLKVKVAKHFFQHRYDYREEWLRFNHTLSRPGDDERSIDERVVQAIADITESPGGILLLPDEGSRMKLAARWNWKGLRAAETIDASALIPELEMTERVIEFAAIRYQAEVDGAGSPQVDGHDDRDGGRDADRDDEVPLSVPDGLLEDERAWAGVPLIHDDRLFGLVVLERPRIDRALDWEDFDLLKIAGRQAASYLAEARGQEALSDARRFDEFNRRFAFIMHDIKNLVSQLSLLARNAERHADNPEFRADMIATIRGSVDKMNDMLARLSQHHQARADEPKPMALRHLIEEIIRPKQAIADVRVGTLSDVVVMVDPARLEQALLHLVQNALDASGGLGPVWVSTIQDGPMARIEVMDNGSGMSSEFIRTRLFKPFSSTKSGGFGIGAFEARSLIQAMGGQMDVESQVGEGTRFSVRLPLARMPEQGTSDGDDDNKTQSRKMVA